MRRELGKHISNWRLVIIGMVFIFSSVVAMPIGLALAANEDDGASTISAEMRRYHELELPFYGDGCGSGETAGGTTCSSNSDIENAKNADKSFFLGSPSELSAAWSDTDEASMQRLLDNYGDLAVRLGNKYDVPYVAILVQMRYEDPESRCGANNFWGNGCPPGTHDGEASIKAANLGEGFNEYGKTLTNGYHDQAIGIKDPKEYLEKIGPTWVQGDVNDAGYHLINEMKKSVDALAAYIEKIDWCKSLGGGGDSASGSNSGGGGSVSLPEETIAKLEASDIKGKANSNKAAYEAGANDAGIPWQAMAAVHWREASMDPNRSIANGEALGRGTSIDGQAIGQTLSEDAVIAANKLVSIAKSVYDVDITSPSASSDDFAWAFLAYNRGYMYQDVGEPFNKSPYVMNYYDLDHWDMKWIEADSSYRGSRLNNIAGSVNVQLGALTVFEYLGGVSGGGSGDDCEVVGASGDLPTEEELRRALDNADSLTDGSAINSGNSTPQTVKVAKVLWHFFKDDFSVLSTYEGSGTSCHVGSSRGMGRGIDLMISDYHNPVVRKRIEAIAEWISDNKAMLTVVGVIYYDKIWYGAAGTPYSSWNAYHNLSNDTQAHRDHIHISVDGCNG
ncbi:MAG: hypothetical protein FWD27_04600 [Coriobacteriia bacterium]|nr:hypothetical protein [Coriobacteriia bacterium]